MTERRYVELAPLSPAEVTRARFEHRGLSERTINALVQNGVDAPERVLCKSKAELFRMKGVGDVSVREIVKYQEQFGETK